MRSLRRHFGVQVVFRALLLLAVMALLAWVLVTTRLVVTPFVLFLLCLGLVAEFMMTVQRTNRELVQFLDRIEHDDVLQRPGPGLRGAGFEELSASMGRVLDRLRAIRLAREQEVRTLRSIIENVPVPLFSVRDDGRVDVHNHAARRFFAPRVVTTVDRLGPWGPGLSQAIADQPPGESGVVRLGGPDDAPSRMAVSLADIVVGGQRQRLVTLQNISGELAASELEAWQQMAQVLAHEIMNSLTPVASLAGTATALLETGKEEDRDKAAQAIDTVARRADALMEFVQGYRRFTRLPAPTLAPARVGALLRRVERLLTEALIEAGVTCEVSVRPEDLEITVDADQVEQVLINLLRNALHAVSEEAAPRIELAAFLDRRGRPVITVADNGPGVPADRREQVFVPFYTTRRGGSGVGLALSRQVMIGHGGALSVGERPGGGASFRLQF